MARRGTSVVEDWGAGSLNWHQHPEDVHSTALFPRPALGTSPFSMSHCCLLEPANSASRTVPGLRASTSAAAAEKQWLPGEPEPSVCRKRYWAMRSDPCLETWPTQHGQWGDPCFTKSPFPLLHHYSKMRWLEAHHHPPIFSLPHHSECFPHAILFIPHGHSVIMNYFYFYLTDLEMKI